MLREDLLKDDVDRQINGCELIRRVEVEDNGVGIADGCEDKIYDGVRVGEGGDELLSLEGIEASYVVGKGEDNLVGICGG